MAVLFTSRTGRTLRNDDLSAAGLDILVGRPYLNSPSHVEGYEYGASTVFHVRAADIVEWWDVIDLERVESDRERGERAALEATVGTLNAFRASLLNRDSV